MERSKQSMNHIIGNDALKARLCDDIMNDSLLHAYILEGPAGSGKSTIALMAAAALSCESKSDSSKPLPCMSCPTCKKILEFKSPDVIFKGTDGKASIGVDIARFLKEDVHTVPNDLEHKVYIIEDADKMTSQAQNALLLTLEEPPSFVHFFLLCNNATSLLDTIKSRAPTLRTEPVLETQIDEYICNHDTRAAQMKLSSKREYLELLKASEGGIGKALELLEAKNWKPIRDMRGLVNDFIVSAINRKGPTNIISVTFGFSTKRDVLHQQLILLLSAVRDLIVLKKSESVNLKFYADTELAIELCDRTPMSFLYTLQNAIINAIEQNKQNANVKLLLTKMLVTADLI